MRFAASVTFAVPSIDRGEDDIAPRTVVADFVISDVFSFIRPRVPPDRIPKTQLPTGPRTRPWSYDSFAHG
jgi:hypothetical protein